MTQIDDGLSTRAAASDSTRAALLAAAVATLDRGGEQAIRVRDIAAAHGMSVGAMYHHFENREGLIVAARIEQFAGAVSEDLDAIRVLVESSTTVDQFRTGMRAIARAAHSPDRAVNRQLRAEVIGAARHNPELAAALAGSQQARMDEHLAVIGLAKDKGFIRPDLDSHAVGLFSQGIALGLVLDDVTPADRVDRDLWGRLVDALIDTILVAED